MQNNSALDVASMCALSNGLLVLVHAFMLSYRAAITSASWGDAGDRRALDDPTGQLLAFCLTLYLIDAVCVWLVLLPTILENKAGHSAWVLRLLTACHTSSSMGANFSMALQRRDSGDSWPSFVFRVSLVGLELARRYGAWIPIDGIVLLGGSSLNVWSGVTLLRLLRLKTLAATLRAIYRLLRYKAKLPVGWGASDEIRTHAAEAPQHS